MTDDFTRSVSDPARVIGPDEARHDPAAFRIEQQRLGRVWNFLGFVSDLPKVDDWFRASLGGREIFVQRFEQGLRGFENRCAHRGFPLRVGEKGNGPVVCGFHHWRYNADGLALGIPQCPEMFGKIPRELNARIERVEIDTCGPLIFGRFSGGTGESLAEWLGEAAPILAHLTAIVDEKPSGVTIREVNANWRSLLEISLDDYHLVAVHPTTFGKNGYLNPEGVKYFRFGMHSSFMGGAGETGLADMARECAEGTYKPGRYRIFQIFPNLLFVVVFGAKVLGDEYRYLVIQDFSAKAHDRTRMTNRVFRLPANEAQGLAARLARHMIGPYVDFGVRFYSSRVQSEDNEACERLQRVIRAGDPPPHLALHEARISWFTESYVKAVAP
ncbi:MAG: Rieske 2Fe-2S domain-containing protein [Proteobacteria bacterium]|nr:Rieske 2Fe-2S domain-containing protein [Pseudomonadota bacterium]